MQFRKFNRCKPFASVGCLVGLVCVSLTAAAADDLPVREITIFKDGHAFVLHQGEVTTNQQGEVELERLPMPVIGTFWAYSSDPKARLASVVASRRMVSVPQTPLTPYELLEANVGARVLISENGEPEYKAKVLRVPMRRGDEFLHDANVDSVSDVALRMPERGSHVLLEVENGVRVVNIDRISGLTFLDKPQGKVQREEIRNSLRLRFGGRMRPEGSTAEVGMVYLQKGVRWIPSYHVEIDGAGSAHVRLQATLVNELADLDEVTAHLVIGVPSFAFADTVDPISLQETMVQLSSAFQRDNQTAYAFSNAIMSQQIAVAPRGVQGIAARPTIDLGPDVATGGKHEDLYVFTIEGVTLAKGERMVLPIAEVTLPYRDVFKLELPFTPPPEIRSHVNNQQQAQLARLFQTPKVKHNLRLDNTSRQPLTTAPALVFERGRLLAQGLIAYTATGSSSDLEVTTAVDISAHCSDREVGRTPDATRWSGSSLDRVDLEGSVQLVSHRGQTIDIEVERQVLGHIDSAGYQGTFEQNPVNQGGWMAATPWWWSSYNWPHWWYHVNPVGRVEWTLKLEPEEVVELTYGWHYFWD
ncbi:MAG: hypothetical protein GY906_06255 [bacterium]|nr:hypothetical protein [bacterium]